MLDRTDDRGLTEQPSPETTSVQPQWRAPALTVLGDAGKLTQTGGANPPDGPGSSAPS